MTRLHPWFASINNEDSAGVQNAVIPTGNGDPKRYENPRKIDLKGDHSDSLTFSMTSKWPCLVRDFAPDVMAPAVAHLVRTQADWNAVS
ncbi:MAG: hypothetical protein CL927_17205 [Deltaproteobacteria bacterium]|nr:hypothetical protein [Deltaproteobacteria bacterium]HCH63765.1 hypothetical protein [Deltaproteobacteria bacterium]